MCRSSFLVCSACTVKNAVELLGAFRPDVEKIQYHWWNLFVVLPCVFSSTLLTSKKVPCHCRKSSTVTRNSFILYFHSLKNLDQCWNFFLKIILFVPVFCSDCDLNVVIHISPQTEVKDPSFNCFVYTYHYPVFWIKQLKKKIFSLSKKFDSDNEWLKWTHTSLWYV